MAEQENAYLRLTLQQDVALKADDKVYVSWDMATGPDKCFIWVQRENGDVDILETTLERVK